MPLATNPNFWFPKLGAVLDGIRPGLAINDAQCRAINAALTNLPFGAGRSVDHRRAQVNAILVANGFPSDALTVANVSNEDMAKWYQGELAQMQLRKKIREKLGTFDPSADRTAFMTLIGEASSIQQVASSIQQVSDYLIATELATIIGRPGNRHRFAATCRFRALSNAFARKLYPFDIAHQRAFLNAVVARTASLLIAGVSSADVSAAIIRFLPVADADSFDAIAALYAPGAALADHNAAFVAAVQPNVHQLIEGGVTYATLVPEYFASAAELHAAILANLQLAAPKRMTADQFLAVVTDLYVDATKPLYADLDSLAQAFTDRVAAATVADILALQPYVAHLPDEGGAFNTAVAGRAQQLVEAVHAVDQLRHVLDCLTAARAQQGLERLREQLVNPEVLDRLLQDNIPLAEIVAAHGNDMTAEALFAIVIGNLDTADLARMQQLRVYVSAADVRPGFGMAADVERVAQLNAAIIDQAPRLVRDAADLAQLETVANVLGACDANGVAALQAQLADRANMAALFGKTPPIALADIARLHGVVAPNANADAQAAALFQPFIVEVTTANAERILNLQRLVVAGRPADGQKPDFDRAVAAQANRLLGDATTATIADVITMLRACDTDNVHGVGLGLAALNAYAAVDANVITLLNKGVSIADIAAMRAAPNNTTDSVAGIIVTAVTAGTAGLTTPAELLRAQNALAAVAGYDFTAFRAALAVPANVDRLFTAVTAASHADLVRLIHENHAPAADDPFKKAFVGAPVVPPAPVVPGNLSDSRNVEALLGSTTPARANPLTINQIEQLATGQVVYNHADNAAFRQTHINAITAELETYLNSVKSENGQWKHKPGAAEENATPAQIQAKLVEFRTRLERFNDATIVAAAARQGADVTRHHGTRALQLFFTAAENASLSNKVLRVYGGNIESVRSFARCDLGSPVQQQALINGIKAKITAAANIGALNEVVRSIAGLTAAGWFESSTDRLRQEVAVAAKEHMLSTAEGGALLGLLERMTPVDIVAACNHLNPLTSAASVTTVETIKANLLSYVKDLVRQANVPGVNLAALRGKLAQVMTACDAHAALNKAAIVKELSEHFLEFVGAGLITQADNFAQVKPFLGAAVPEDSLANAVIVRRNQFFDQTLDFANITANRLSTVAVLKELKILATAHDTVAQAVAVAAGGVAAADALFAHQLHGSLAALAEIGKLHILLASGLTSQDIFEFLAIPAGAEGNEARGQIFEKVQAYLAGEVAQIAAVRDPAAKQQAQARFAAVVRIVNNTDDANVKDAIKARIIDAAVDLLRSGVSINDLFPIDNARLSAETLGVRVAAQVSVAASPEERGQLTGLLAEMQRDNVRDASAAVFFASLPSGFQDEVRGHLAGFNIPKSQQDIILARAFESIKSRFAANIDRAGKFTDSVPSIRIVFLNAFRDAVNAVAPQVIDETLAIQKKHGLAPGELYTSNKVAREAVRNLSERTHEIRDSAIRLKMQALEKLLKEISELTTVANDTGTQDAYDALQEAKRKLGGYSASDIEALTAVHAADRKHLEDLATEINEKLIAIDMLMLTDSEAVFKDTLLGEIGQWPDLTATQLANIKEVLNSQLSNVSDFFTAVEWRARTKEGLQRKRFAEPQIEKILRNLTRSEQKAHQVTIDRIATKLDQQRVAYTDEARRDIAKDLVSERFTLLGIKRKIEEQLANPADVAEIQQLAKDVQEQVNDAVAGKQARTEYVGKKPVVFEIESAELLGDAAGLTPDYIKKLFPAAAVGGRDADLDSRNTAKIKDLNDRTYVVKLDDAAFTKVNVLSEGAAANRRPIGVTIDTKKVTVVADAAAGTMREIATATLRPGTPEFVKYATELGMMLAQAKMDASAKDQYKMFSGNRGKVIKITGDFSAANCNTPQGKFDLAVMDVAIEIWRQHGYSIKRDSVAQDHVAAITASGGRYISEPEFIRAMAANADSIAARTQQGDLQRKMEDVTRDLGANMTPTSTPPRLGS